MWQGCREGWWLFSSSMEGAEQSGLLQSGASCMSFWLVHDETQGYVLTGDAEAAVKTPQKTAWRSNTIAEEPEEEDADAEGNRPHALSASACQQVPTFTRMSDSQGRLNGSDDTACSCTLPLDFFSPHHRNCTGRRSSELGGNPDACVD